MTLHSSKDRDDMSVRDRWFALFIDPPIVEGRIGVNEESLFRWRCLSKSVGDIGTIDKQVLGCRNSIENVGTGSVDAVRVCMVKDPYLARTGGSVTDATSFLASVEFFNDIRPNEMEYS